MEVIKIKNKDALIEVNFKCKCGRELIACFYNNEPEDLVYCECGIDEIRIIRPEIIIK